MHGMLSNTAFECTMQRVQTLSDTLVANIMLWKRIRGPFILPSGILGHSCDSFWQSIAVDCAGCTVCGKLHICHDHNTKLMHNKYHVESHICELAHQMDARVCRITGLCMKTHVFKNSDHLNQNTLEDVSPEISSEQNGGKQKASSKTVKKGDGKFKTNNFKTNNKTMKNHMNNRSRKISHHTKQVDQGRSTGVLVTQSKTPSLIQHIEGFRVMDTANIFAICSGIINSDTTAQCFQREQNKFDSRVRWSLTKHLREFKQQHQERTPVQMVSIISNVARDLHNYRLFTKDTDSLAVSLPESRQLVSALCTRVITRFVNTAQQFVRDFMYNMHPRTFVVGILYLMRVGLVAHNIIVLPCVKVLVYLLPCENLLHQYFNIKCKSITEVENIVKLHVRALNIEQLHELAGHI
jgi:hypothetical protein